MARLPASFAGQLATWQTRFPERWAGRAGAAIAIAAGGLACGLVTVYGALWLGFLLLGLGLFALATLHRPQVGILVTIGVLYILPYGVLPLPVGTLHPTFLDLSLMVTLLAWVLRLLSHPQERLILTPVGGLVLLFLGIAVTAFLFGISSVSGEVLRLFLKTVAAIFFFFTVINGLRTRPEIERTTQVLLLGAGSAGAIASALYFLPPASSGAVLSALGGLGYPAGDNVLRYIADTPILRATGTAIDPNVLGGMLLLALPLAVSQALDRQPVLPRWLLAAIMLLILGALLLTYSRSAWVGAFAGLLVLAALRYRRLWLFLGVGAGLLLLLPQASTFVERFQSGVLLADRAAQMRLGEYRDALRLIGQYPVLGVGFGEPPNLDLYVATSSIYLLIAEEMGLVGLGAFLLVLGGVFWTSYRRHRWVQRHGLESTQLGTLGGTVGALCAGLFDHYFFNIRFPHAITLFWLGVGLLVATGVVSQNQEEPRAGE